MKSPAKSSVQGSFLMPTLAEQCDPRQPLVKLAREINWQVFEASFGEYYSDQGRPAKPIRLMVGLLLLKQLENLSDEALVERWVQNPYYQYFCGLEQFPWEAPCDPSDLVYFRRRLGEEGASVILAVSAHLHKDRAQEKEIVVDTTVQEKNITPPTDTKLARKIIQRCWKLAFRFVVRLEDALRLVFVARLEACLRAGDIVLEVKDAPGYSTERSPRSSSPKASANAWRC